VAGEVQCERAGGGTCGRVLGDAARRREHARLPSGAFAGEAVEALRQLAEPREVGPQPRDLVLGSERDVDVLDAVVVDLDRQLRALDTEHVE
jgi:hypothetical protein